MRKIALLGSLFLLCLLTAEAQKKNFSYDQLFKGAATNISKPLPSISGWADDEHYLEVRKDQDGKSTVFSVDARTGEAKPYVAPADAKAPTPTVSIKDARNLSISPDKKWAAYTKPDNNLYITEIESKKETKLTNDGSDV